MHGTDSLVPAVAKDAATGTTSKPLFTHTTQYRHYLVPPSHLVAQATKTATDGQVGTAAVVPGVDAQGAALLQQYYLSRMPRLANAFELPERVLATAMSYFKRFWLTRGVAQPLVGHGPARAAVRGAQGVKAVMLICLYLATKTHSIAIPLQHFASRVAGGGPSSGGGGGSGGSGGSSSTPSSGQATTAAEETQTLIRDYEFEVASVLGWRFRVIHAFEGVRGMSLELQRFDSKMAQPAFLDAWVKPLKQACAHLRMSEAEFLYTPSQCALGIWWAVCRGEAEAEAEGGNEQDAHVVRAALDKWIQDKAERGATAAPTDAGPHMDAESLKAVAAKVADLVRKGSQQERLMADAETLAKVREVDAALKRWSAERDAADATGSSQSAGNDGDAGGGDAAAGRKRSTHDSAGQEGGDEEVTAAKRAKVDRTGPVDSDDDDDE
ncbi:unnamed protein product [Parajaminaea phylloscopi]